jgi:hypothetical protein
MMRTFTQRLLAAVLFGVLFGVIVPAQATNQHVGMWTADMATSKMSSGPALKSGTTKIELAGSGVKYMVDIAAVDGNAWHWEFTANYDGKDNPVTGNSPWGDVVALTQVDAKTVRTVNKKDGKVLSTQMSVVSNDGKTRTVTTKGTNALGQTIEASTTYQRQ